MSRCHRDLRLVGSTPSDRSPVSAITRRRRSGGRLAGNEEKRARQSANPVQIVTKAPRSRARELRQAFDAETGLRHARDDIAQGPGELPFHFRCVLTAGEVHEGDAVYLED